MLQEQERLLHRSHFEKKRKPKRKFLRFFLITLFLLGIAGFVFNLFTKKDNTPTTLSSEEQTTILEKVSSIMLVPDEEPYIFTITDVDTLLKDQKFFAGAKNGDVLFIFPNASKAVIYSPERNVIVNSGPLVVDDTLSNTNPSLEASQDISQEGNTQNSQ